MKQTFFKSEQGFSAVELLITLFIGFLFIMMGYQLYSTIIADSGESRQRATANNIAYAELRKYAGAAATYSGACTATGGGTVVPSSNNNPVPEVSTAARITTTICIPSNIPSLRRVTVKVDLGNQQEVVHAIYVEA